MEADSKRLEAPRCLGSKLIVRRMLGRGGTASVFEAHDLELDRIVAVKVAEHGARPPGEAGARLLREADAYARIADPRLPCVYRVDTLPNEVPVMVMEMIRGRTLRELLDEQGPLPVSLACHLAEELLAILERVHACGLMHRDIKPSNVLIEGDPATGLRLRLIDFGICRDMADVDATSITREGDIVGTPTYMPAEQLRGMPLDERVDIYAVGALLFELLTGRPPHGRLPYAEMIAAILRDEPPKIRHVRPEVSAPLASVVERALGKWPWMRYETAGAMREALEAATVAQPASPYGIRPHPFEATDLDTTEAMCQPTEVQRPSADRSVAVCETSRRIPRLAEGLFAKAVHRLGQLTSARGIARRTLGAGMPAHGERSGDEAPLATRQCARLTAHRVR